MSETCSCKAPACTSRTVQRFGVEWDHENDRPKGPARVFAEKVDLCAECAECHDENAAEARCS